MTAMSPTSLRGLPTDSSLDHSELPSSAAAVPDAQSSGSGGSGYGAARVSETGRKGEVMTPSSPLFGLPPLPDDELVVEKGHPGGGESPVFSSWPPSGDILVERSPCAYALDDPLPLSTPDLSPDVLSSSDSPCSLRTLTDRAPSPPCIDPVLISDFNVSDYLAQYGDFSSTDATSAQDQFAYRPSDDSFAQPQARACALDSSLQSPLGDSPLLLPSQSVSPTLSSEAWSPDLGRASDFDFPGSSGASPLLFDNLGLGADFSLFHPPSSAPPYAPTTSSGLVSTYLSSPLFAADAPMSTTTTTHNPTFSPVMSQQTYDTLFPTNVCDTPALPALTALPPAVVSAPAPVELAPFTIKEESAPPPASTSTGESALESPEQDEDEDAQDSEWVPAPVSSTSRHRSTRVSTRSTRRRPSLSVSTSTSPAPASVQPTTTKRGSTPATLPLDAPIQTRTYKISSRTSKKPIPKALWTAHHKAVERGEAVPKTEAELMTEADRRRKANTLSARESRRKKKEEAESVVRENGELRGENRALRDEVRELRGTVEGLTRENEALKGRLREIEGGGEEEREARRAKRARVE
ncbi:hypothetical protein JCM10212_001912 [Sporobolomyces blumeae]